MLFIFILEAQMRLIKSNNIQNADNASDRASDKSLNAHSQNAGSQNKMRGIPLTRATILFGIIVAACFSTILGITLYKNSQTTIGSNTYAQIINGHDLASDILPPPAFAIEAYANILHTLRYTTEAKKNLFTFQVQRNQFEERIEHWKNADIPEEIRTAITVDAAEPLNEFWEVAEKEFFGALIGKPGANIHRAFNIITKAFGKHKDAVLTAKIKVKDYLATTEAAAQQKLSTLNMIYYAVISISLLVLIGSLIATLKFVVKPMTEIANYTAQLAQNSETGAVPHTNRRDEIGAIANSLTKFREANFEKIVADNKLTAERERTEALSQTSNKERTTREEQTAKAIDEIGSALKRMAQGDLTCKIEKPFDGELDRLRTDLNAAIVQFGGTFNKILNTSESLGTGVREIVTASDDLSVRTEQQAASLEETANSLTQITQTVEKASQGAENTRVIVEIAKTDAQASGVVVEKALNAMSEIETSAKEINQIISVIDEIAFQTNLLALNAGVEAARAGEAGLGFAVVASEVRALAQRSATAAKEIKELISKSSEQVAGGSKLVGETGEALHKISEQVLEISDVVDEIAIGTKKQFSSLNDLNATVSEMDAGTQQNAAMAEEATAACHSLRNEADELINLMGTFKVDGHEASNSLTPSASKYSAKSQIQNPSVKTSDYSGRVAKKAAPINTNTTIATAQHKPTKSPAKTLISRVTTAFSSNAAVKDEEWEEF